MNAYMLPRMINLLTLLLHLSIPQASVLEQSELTHGAPIAQETTGLQARSQPTDNTSAGSLLRLQQPMLGATRAYTLYLPLTLVRTPTITQFSANPSRVTFGQSSTLHWNVSGATNLLILPNVGVVNGTSVIVNPTLTTIYTLSASNSAGTVTATTTIDVSLDSSSNDVGKLFPPSDTNNSQANVAIDAAGAIHMVTSPADASVLAAASNNAQPQALFSVQYAFCTAGCAVKSNWRVVSIGNAGFFGGDARLALDPQGHPRVLWFEQTNVSDDGLYMYAACDTNCTVAANWTSVQLPFSEYVGPTGNQYFALDPQGRPRFVYTDTKSTHGGLFFAFCDSACTAATNWHEGTISDAYQAYGFSMVYDNTGTMHLVYAPTTRDVQWSSVIYVECVQHCEQGHQWHSVALGFNSPSWSLRLDSAGHPRLLIFNAGTIHYLWCDENCAASGEHWTNQDLHIASGVVTMDLALDRQNRPHIAYPLDNLDSEGLIYAWCSASCETSTPSWRNITVEQTDDLGTVSNCYWSSVGRFPSLALDAADNPRIGYDAVCRGVGVELTHLVRFTLFNQ